MTFPVGAPPGAVKNVVLTATSVADPAAVDVVKAVARN